MNFDLNARQLAAARLRRTPRDAIDNGALQVTRRVAVVVAVEDAFSEAACGPVDDRYDRAGAGFVNDREETFY